MSNSLSHLDTVTFSHALGMGAAICWSKWAVTLQWPILNSPLWQPKPRIRGQKTLWCFTLLLPNKTTSMCASKSLAIWTWYLFHSWCYLFAHSFSQVLQCNFLDRPLAFGPLQFSPLQPSLDCIGQHHSMAYENSVWLTASWAIPRFVFTKHIWNHVGEYERIWKPQLPSLLRMSQGNSPRPPNLVGVYWPLNDLILVRRKNTTWTTAKFNWTSTLISHASSMLIGNRNFHGHSF